MVAPEQVGTDPVDEVEEVDVAVAAYRSQGRWQVEELPDRVLESLDDVVVELRRRAGEDVPDSVGALGLLSVGEDFALVVRVQGSRVRLLLSDVDAAADWTLAQDAVDHLGVRVADLEGLESVGDLDLLVDLDVGPDLLEELLEDDELFPEEVLSDLAEALGFGEAFDEVAGLEQ